MKEVNSAYSKEEFCKIYNEYKDRLYRYALYKLGDPLLAEDAVSECVLAAWRSSASLRSRDAFGAWIFSILRSICAGQIRKLIADRNITDRISTQNINEGDAEFSDESVHSSRTQNSIELAEALNELNEEERDIVLLSVVSGLNSREIAGLTGLAPGAVRSKLSRSLGKMRNYLEKNS